MKKPILIVAIITLVISILASSGVLKSILRFVLFGEVPGTTTSLSPFIMTCLVLVFTWMLSMQLVEKIGDHMTLHHREAKVFLSRKKRMPKRRFAR